MQLLVHQRVCIIINVEGGRINVTGRMKRRRIW